MQRSLGFKVLTGAEGRHKCEMREGKKFPRGVDWTGGKGGDSGFLTVCYTCDVTVARTRAP
jgi:hypothetical protein